MRHNCKVAVIIPACNEAESIGRVIEAIPDWIDDVIVADNASTDGTPERARAAGARVVHEARRGYGSACLAGMAALRRPDVVVFLDGDASDHPEEMHLLVDPVARGAADLVIGSRTLGRREPGALTLPQLFGNWLACRLMRLFWNARFTDLGPFRAVRAEALLGLGMRDPDFGWTVEMQIKAARACLRLKEVPVSYRPRIGTSKISGTLSGSIRAGRKILSTIFSEFLAARRDAGPRRLIVFARYPRPGSTKTRLIPALGPEGAARLQRRMTEHVVDWTRALCRARSVQAELRFAGGDRSLLRRWLGPGLPCLPQAGGDLGARQEGAFRDAFRAGPGRVLIIGTDCPALTPALCLRAFGALQARDLVLGPTFDGGYYLIGLRRAQPRLMGGVAWGTETVLRTIQEKAERMGLSVALLEPLSDVDRAEDLPVWEAVRRRACRAVEVVSVIIPALGEASHIHRTLSALAGAREVEVIVVDGGSTDRTAEIARELGARLVRSPPGRARQMNAGAAVARGDALLFLHADTLLPPGFEAQVRRALHRPGVAAGAFELGIDGPGPRLRWVERAVNLRSRYLQMPYGDQALFIRAHHFHRMGGFPELPIMEDVAWVRRARRRGRIEIVPAAVRTSARRWQALGLWRTTLVNQLSLAAFHLGLSTRWIYSWYYRDRRAAPVD